MLKTFIIISLVCTVGIGSFIGVIVGSCVKKNNVLHGIITAIIIGLIFGGLATAENYKEKKDWNDGICIKCGGEYKFEGASKSMHGFETLYYTCENCDYLIRQ